MGDNEGEQSFAKDGEKSCSKATARRSIRSGEDELFDSKALGTQCLFFFALPVEINALDGGGEWGRFSLSDDLVCTAPSPPPWRIIPNLQITLGRGRKRKAQTTLAQVSFPNPQLYHLSIGRVPPEIPAAMYTSVSFDRYQYQYQYRHDYSVDDDVAVDDQMLQSLGFSLVLVLSTDECSKLVDAVVNAGDEGSAKREMQSGRYLIILGNDLGWLAWLGCLAWHFRFFQTRSSLFRPKPGPARSSHTHALARKLYTASPNSLSFPLSPFSFLSSLFSASPNMSSR